MINEVTKRIGSMKCWNWEGHLVDKLQINIQKNEYKRTRMLELHEIHEKKSFYYPQNDNIGLTFKENLTIIHAALLILAVLILVFLTNCDQKTGENQEITKELYSN